MGGWQLTLSQSDKNETVTIYFTTCAFVSVRTAPREPIRIAAAVDAEEQRRSSVLIYVHIRQSNQRIWDNKTGADADASASLLTEEPFNWSNLLGMETDNKRLL